MSFSLLSSPVYAVGLQPQEIFSLFSEFILHGSKSVLSQVYCRSVSQLEFLQSSKETWRKDSMYVGFEFSSNSD